MNLQVLVINGVDLLALCEMFAGEKLCNQV
jgi:hypothetical protein